LRRRKKKSTELIKNSNPNRTQTGRKKKEALGGFFAWKNSGKEKTKKGGKAKRGEKTTTTAKGGHVF